MDETQYNAQDSSETPKPAFRCLAVKEKLSAPNGPPPPIWVSSEKADSLRRRMDAEAMLRVERARDEQDRVQRAQDKHKRDLQRDRDEESMRPWWEQGRVRWMRMEEHRLKMKGGVYLRNEAGGEARSDKGFRVSSSQLVRLFILLPGEQSRWLFHDNAGNLIGLRLHLCRITQGVLGAALSSSFDPPGTPAPWNIQSASFPVTGGHIVADIVANRYVKVRFIPQGDAIAWSMLPSVRRSGCSTEFHAFVVLFVVLLFLLYRGV